MGMEEVKKRAVVPVIRGASPENIIPIGEALKKGGITSLEITMETPGAIKALEAAVFHFGDDMLIGAGTVLDAETARVAIISGAKFIFSPTNCKDTILMAKRYGVISVPGALTPTEILQAFEYGADVIKVFPAEALGPKYLKYIAGPLPQIPLMPTGGIHLENAREYIKAGAIAVGVGSTLVDTKHELTEDYLSQITEKAQKFMYEVEQARQS